MLAVNGGLGMRRTVKLSSLAFLASVHSVYNLVPKITVSKLSGCVQRA